MSFFIQNISKLSKKKLNFSFLKNHFSKNYKDENYFLNKKNTEEIQKIWKQRPKIENEKERRVWFFNFAKILLLEKNQNLIETNSSLLKTFISNTKQFQSLLDSGEIYPFELLLETIYLLFKLKNLTFSEINLNEYQNFYVSLPMFKIITKSVYNREIILKTGAVQIIFDLFEIANQIKELKKFENDLIKSIHSIQFSEFFLSNICSILLNFLDANNTSINKYKWMENGKLIPLLISLFNQSFRISNNSLCTLVHYKNEMKFLKIFQISILFTNFTKSNSIFSKENQNLNLDENNQEQNDISFQIKQNAHLTRIFVIEILENLIVKYPHLIYQIGQKNSITILVDYILSIIVTFSSKDIFNKKQSDEEKNNSNNLNDNKQVLDSEKLPEKLNFDMEKSPFSCFQYYNSKYNIIQLDLSSLSFDNLFSNQIFSRLFQAISQFYESIYKIELQQQEKQKEQQNNQQNIQENKQEIQNFYFSQRFFSIFIGIFKPDFRKNIYESSSA
ncbi:hypothetical protein M0811_14835 [Anaeramoeba ignava]|uniref:Uncharacterized protein n=1 Tax=Anaeramoeba ignava TaxID=1746090 RepID=A0A9Q0LWL2_ANAIG|nr:hypothetical protein M0811_14835 [Anaeramoeba ignava]